MSELIEKKVKEIAEKHARIIEFQCEKACKEFNISPEQLIIEYHSNAEILIKASYFKIVNNFVYNNGQIIEEGN